MMLMMELVYCVHDSCFAGLRHVQHHIKYACIGMNVRSS